MTTSIKLLWLFVLISLQFSCTDSTTTESSTATSTDKTITIKGIIRTIENGKDGYTANVLTDNEGMYAALVSIVNLGGPENFQQFNIGDRVSLKGTAYEMGGAKQLKVEKIIDVQPTRTQLLISPISFRGIQVGDLIANHSEYIQKNELHTGEGTFDVYEIKDFDNNPAGYLLPDPNDELLVGDIVVQSPKAQTAKGIKVGDTFADLEKAFPNIPVHGSEIEGRTHASANNLYYRLDVVNFSYEIDRTKIPATAKITEIRINRGPMAEALILNEKYNNTLSDEYCWQTNKVLNLYTKPNINSVLQGKHFQGEILNILGTQFIDNELWVNVTYKLQIKAGYEHQFADGQVHSSGSPTGWVGGKETPIINCK